MSEKYLSTKNRYVVSVEMWGKVQKDGELASYFSLKEKLYFTVTGKPYNLIYTKYGCYHQECVEEEYREEAGITFARSWDRFIHIFIPKTEEGSKIVEYLLNQKHCKVRLLKRASMYDIGISTYYRDLNKDFMIKLAKRLNEKDTN